MSSEGAAGTGPTGPSPLDRRLEALVEASNGPAPQVPGASPGGPVDEGTLAELVADIRGMREAFLSLPTLDVLEERLVAIEAAIDRLTEAFGPVLGRLDGAPPSARLPDGEAPVDPLHADDEGAAAPGAT